MASNASVATEAIFTSPALRPVCENLLVGEPPQTRRFGPSWPEAPGLGRLPNKQIFTDWPQGRACENGFCGHRSIACHLAAPRKSPLKTRKRRTSYLPSVSLAALIAWMVASTIFNSFSSSEFSIASIRFLHSLPLFLDG